MSISIQFVVLYLVPIVSFAGAVGIYARAYGKDLEHTYINPVFVLILVGFAVSCFITQGLVSYFTEGETNYLGVVLAILPCVINFLVIALYAVVFYGVFNP